jgi:hypothetical protein
MNDLRTLSDAFNELERRADVATDAHPYVVPTQRRRSRTPLVVATVVTVAGVAAATAVLSTRGDAAHQQSAGDPTAPGPTAPAPTPSTSSAPAAYHIPETAAELADQFRTVLGDTATFTVTYPTDMTARQTRVPAMAPDRSGDAVATNVPMATDYGTDAYIAGTLSAGGVTGGFDLQIFQSSPDETAFCDDSDQAQCSVTSVNGGQLALGRVTLANTPDGVTFQADYINADGVEFLMHLSNERDPKGASAVLAPQPPMTLQQLGALVTSDRWLD